MSTRRRPASRTDNSETGPTIDPPERLGERLRTLRKARGRSIEDLAELSGISARTIRRRERAGYDSLWEIVAVCLALDMHPAAVLFQGDLDQESAALAALLPVPFLELMDRIAARRREAA